MKALLTITLLANVALAVWIGVELKRSSEFALSETVTLPSTSNLPASLRGKRTSARTVVVTNASQFTWRKVEAKDFKTYMANLRAVGCPEETVRDIIIADVERVYSRKTSVFRKPPEEFQFWKTGNASYASPPLTADEQKQFHELNKEKEALLKELLGDDYRKDLMRQSPYGYGWVEDPFLEGMSKDKKDALQEIQSRFGEERSEIYRKAKGYTTQEDRDDLKRIDRQVHDEMAKILSPQELFEYEVRTSQLASNMKYNDLRGFDPTEQEFRTLFKAKQEVELMQGQLTTDLKTALGEDRFREYERAKDYDYQNLLRFTESRDLPREAADNIYQLKDEVQKAASEIRRNKELTEDQRIATLETLRVDVEKVGLDTLGERNFNSYKRIAPWLRDLATLPSARKPTTPVAP